MSLKPETLAIPRFCLVVLMGPSGSGKTTFSKRWFPESAIVSSEKCRWMVADDKWAEWASAEAFALLETWVAARLKLGLLTVVDAASLEPRFRMRMLDLAREYHAPALLMITEESQRTCQERNSKRERPIPGDVLSRQVQRFHKAVARVKDEGWNRVIRFRPGECAGAVVEIRPLRVDCSVGPPYDLIGDVHGCLRELEELLVRLGYVRDPVSGFRHPEGRHVVFVGDLVDRGPDSVGVMRLAMAMNQAGVALVCPGNHDEKLLRYLSGARVRIDHGLERTVAELDRMDAHSRASFSLDVCNWIRGLPPYLLLHEGLLVVAHAGLPEHLHGRLSRPVAAWALYGDGKGAWNGSAGSRKDWTVTYQGKALVVYGHTPSIEPRRRGNTLCIDQGCVFGGRLTALCYPEGRFVQVPAFEAYYPDDAPDLEEFHAAQVESGRGAGSVEGSLDGSLPGSGEVASLEYRKGGRENTTPGGDGHRPGAGGKAFSANTTGIRFLPDPHGNNSIPLLEGDDTGLSQQVEFSFRYPGPASFGLPGEVDPASVTETGLVLSDPISGDPVSGDPGTGGRVFSVRGVARHIREGTWEQAAEGPHRPGEEFLSALPAIQPLLSGGCLPTSWLGDISIAGTRYAEALRHVSTLPMDPRWLVYMPPEVAACPPTSRPDLLEHPQELFQYYRSTGLDLVIEALPISARCVVVIGRDPEACRRRLGVGEGGALYGMAGRSLLPRSLATEVLDHIRSSLDSGGVFDRLKADLLIFEACIRPWSLCHREHLIRGSIPAAEALLRSRSHATEAIQAARERGVPMKGLLATAARDKESALQLRSVCAQSLWPVNDRRDFQLVPFQLLATGDQLWIQKDRQVQLEEMDRWCQVCDLFRPVERRVVSGPEDERAAIAFWEKCSWEGGAGIVARTREWFPYSQGRPEVPAMRVRGRDYLRLCLGPLYLNPETLEQLKVQSFKMTRVHALREWALASTGLAHFVSGGTFAQVHPYALAVIASQSEPTDGKGQAAAAPLARAF